LAAKFVATVKKVTPRKMAKAKLPVTLWIDTIRSTLAQRENHVAKKIMATASCAPRAHYFCIAAPLFEWLGARSPVGQPCAQ
jgi:hypothetical protein